MAQGHGKLAAVLRALPFASAVAVLAAAAFAPAAPAAVHNGRIAYVHQVDEGQYEIVTIRPDGTGERRVVGPRRHYRRPMLPRFSPGGKRLAFANGAGRPTLPGPLWRSELDGTSVREIRTGLKSPFPTGLSWAPDGGRLVMTSARGPDDHRMHTVRTRGGGRRSLGRGRDAVWSPDGRWIAYAADGLWIVRPDGSDRRRIADATAVVAPSFSPDGREVLFTRDTASFEPVEWWTVRLADGRLRKVADRPVSADHHLCPPQWSPDGERLAAMRIDAMTDGSRRRVFVTSDPDGSDERVEFALPERNTGDQPCDFSWQRRVR